MKKVLTQEEKLSIFALFVMAIEHHNEVQRYERAIAKILGDRERYNGHMSDAIYSNDAQPHMKDFEDVLERIGIKTLAKKSSR